MMKILGAGLIGLATAFELASRGIKVQVIDPAPMSGASYWAAGMLAPVAEMVYRQEKLFPLMDDSAARYPDLVARVAKTLGIAPEDCGLRQEGTLVVGGDPGDRALLAELTQFQQDYGQQVETITTRQARTKEPALAPSITAAVWIPGDHQIDPRVFGAKLMEACTTLGVEFLQRAATKEDLGSTTIVANGLGAKEFFPELPLRPVYGDIMRLRTPAGEPQLLQHVVRAFVCGRHVYLVPRRDGQLVLGASSREDGRTTPQVAGTLDLLRDAAQILPGIRDLDIEQVGAGARPGTPDDLPLVGRDPNTGSVLATGFFRHGILLTAWGAAAAVSVALEENNQDIDLSDVDPWRFA